MWYVCLKWKWLWFIAKYSFLSGCEFLNFVDMMWCSNLRENDLCFKYGLWENWRLQKGMSCHVFVLRNAYLFVWQGERPYLASYVITDFGFEFGERPYLG